MLYKNHEVSCHGVSHRTQTVLPAQNIIQEILEDRRALEKMSGTFVRGMSYANGFYSEEAINTIKSCGIVYARKACVTGIGQNKIPFQFPDDFMKWRPTCHHRDCLEQGELFLKHHVEVYRSTPRLLYVYGHSYEFDRDDNWELIEDFCKMMSGNEKIWYATSIELYEYITSQKQLVVSVDNKRVYNPTGIRIWFSDDYGTYSVGPGEIIEIK